MVHPTFTRAAPKRGKRRRAYEMPYAGSGRPATVVSPPEARAMSDPLRISSTVVIPEDAIAFRAVRSSGPGGQNVNKVASKVELRVDLARILGLGAAARERLTSLCASRLDAEGRLVVTSQRTRDQSRNLEDAREKLRIFVARSLVPPRPRRPTRPTKPSRERRLQEKRLRAERKQGRSRAAED